MEATSRIRSPWLLVVGLLLTLVLLQTVALRTGTDGESTSVEALGSTGFAYLGGLRTFAAAVLWNRIEPIMHEYYGGTALTEQAYMVPSLRLITVLDPQFEQAYYMATWIVYKQVGEEQAIDLAREAVRENPRSGMLVTNLTQVLYYNEPESHREELIEQARLLVSDDVVWFDDFSQFEGVAVARSVFRSLGMEEEAAAAEEELAHLRESGADVGDHDHDGDGKQDH